MDYALDTAGPPPVSPVRAPRLRAKRRSPFGKISLSPTQSPTQSQSPQSQSPHTLSPGYTAAFGRPPTKTGIGAQGTSQQFLSGRVKSNLFSAPPHHHHHQQQQPPPIPADSPFQVSPFTPHLLPQSAGMTTDMDDTQTAFPPPMDQLNGHHIQTAKCNICCSVQECIGCGFCGKPTCSGCVAQCQACLESFCSFCSLSNYDMRWERHFCYSCNKIERGSP
eukprot:m.61389 g.61389  ORF g.61389 m.61389 type:complete len:221 (-) comp11860_c0_seq4:332-994(-)